MPNKVYILYVLLLFALNSVAQQVNINIQNDVVYFSQDDMPILNYQIAETSLNGNYKRCNYIHPLYALNGTILTEDFPEDHPHHRGIFWAWHQILIGNKLVGDSWELQHISWDVDTVKEVTTKYSAKAIQAKVFWTSDLWLDANGHEKPFIQETTTIRVFPKEDNYRKVDIKIELTALVPDVRIGGSENEKGYGGFSTRIKLPDNVSFISNNKHVAPKNLPIKAGNWMDISGSLTNYSQASGLTIFCHPKNPGKTNRWILRKKRSMQNAVYPYPGSKPVNLSNLKPTVLNYRLIIHDDYAKSLSLSKLYSDYKKEKI
ncbi:DUF6807 family protein [Aestuariibaculum sediminum]|uniref:PmoA family protein n=1 Tax=Aestuariibaculum sediminum TaxID=2770637 RepID=A0A8J6UHJ6_9FLAO|nr:DUF6807 family protein [Aestuariibaculum sediminum]MBD0832981.1 PmoA family protein [Aestuariibaculum sediminum]